MENTGNIGDVSADAGNVSPPATETQAQIQARMYKVMVDGREEEVDEDTLKGGYAHNRAAAKRMEEASLLKKQSLDKQAELAEAIRVWQNDPKQIFKKLNIDPRAFAEQLINEELEDALMDPRDKKLRDYEREHTQRSEAERTQREQYEAQQEQAKVEQYLNDISNEIVQEADAIGIPRQYAQETVKRAAYYMDVAFQSGYNVTVKDVMGQVKKDFQTETKSLLGSITPEQMKEYLGEDVYRNILKSSVQAQKKEVIVPKSVNQNRTAPAKKNNKPMSPREFFRGNKGF